jgi:hypothetical protein
VPPEYLPLHEYLDRRYASMVVLTFQQIESLVGFRLPDAGATDLTWLDWRKCDCSAHRGVARHRTRREPEPARAQRGVRTMSGASSGVVILAAKVFRSRSRGERQDSVSASWLAQQRSSNRQDG